MTVFPAHGPGWTSVTANGCTAAGCGSQDTATLDGRHGRRCADHPPTFDPTAAADLARRDPHAALGYCRTDFPGDAA